MPEPSPDLWSSTTLLDVLLETGDAAIIGVSPGGVARLWNAAAARLFGFSESEMRGQSLMRLVPLERQSQARELLASLLRSEKIEALETVLFAKGGRRVHVALSGAPLRDEQGRINGGLLLVRDVSQRRKTRGELAQLHASAQHRAIGGAAPVDMGDLPDAGRGGFDGGHRIAVVRAESAERRKTQMARIVAPDVMEEILAHPEAEYPRSRRVQVSVLFTDLEDFTAYADAREPEEVVEALNAFLARMHPVVTAHGGCIDKYIGDSIMAFFGAPIPRADHAAQALRYRAARRVRPLSRRHRHPVSYARGRA